MFITKGKDSPVVRELADWLIAHNGNPEQVELVASDFGKVFIAGVREHLPNAETVLDTFHLVQIANRGLDRDRAKCQMNGERKKSIRYAFLKNPEKLTPAEAQALMDFTRDNEAVGLSYQMKESLRQVFGYAKEQAELAKAHLERWADWPSRRGRGPSGPSAGQS